MPEAARLNDIAKGDPHPHGCPGCPHSVQGPIIIGSTDVFINGIPAARVGDIGISTPCCGPNMFEIKMGSFSVFINGKQAARKGDMTMHCSVGTGKINMGSTDVKIGD
jgi:uncharacterized Zn-binding protein involved in type VI secretion